jgi:hypothetical protein
MFLNKIDMKERFLYICSFTFIARSASSRASLSLSILIVSFIIGRFGEVSIWRSILGGDFERFIGDIRRDGRTVTGIIGGGGGGNGAGAAGRTGAGGGADRRGTGPIGRIGTIAAPNPGRLGKGDRYIRISRSRRSLVWWASENEKQTECIFLYPNNRRYKRSTALNIPFGSTDNVGHTPSSSADNDSSAVDLFSGIVLLFSLRLFCRLLWPCHWR